MSRALEGKGRSASVGVKVAMGMSTHVRFCLFYPVLTDTVTLILFLHFVRLYKCDCGCQKPSSLVLEKQALAPTEGL